MKVFFHTCDTFPQTTHSPALGLPPPPGDSSHHQNRPETHEGTPPPIPPYRGSPEPPSSSPTFPLSSGSPHPLHNANSPELMAGTPTPNGSFSDIKWKNVSPCLAPYEKTPPPQEGQNHGLRDKPAVQMRNTL